MNNRRNAVAEQVRHERTFEAIASREEGCDLVFDPATGQLVAVDDEGDEDRLPATQMAREGFFCVRQPGLRRERCRQSQRPDQRNPR